MSALWYASRASGIVSLILLTAVVVLGVLINRQGRLPGLPRFVVTGLHRNISLLAVVFLVIHVGSVVLDSYVDVGLISAIVPFTSSYDRFWTGLGTAAVDLLLAVVITSLLRTRIDRRVWRAVHWLGYAMYPVAVAHGIGSGTDTTSGFFLVLTLISAATVVGAVFYRLSAGAGTETKAQREVAWR